MVFLVGLVTLLAQRARQSKSTASAQIAQGFQALSVVPAGQVATVSQSDAQLLAALARAAERCMNESDTVNAETIGNFM